MKLHLQSLAPCRLRIKYFRRRIAEATLAIMNISVGHSGLGYSTLLAVRERHSDRFRTRVKYGRLENRASGAGPRDVRADGRGSHQPFPVDVGSAIEG